MKLDIVISVLVLAAPTLAAPPFVKELRTLNERYRNIKNEMYVDIKTLVPRSLVLLVLTEKFSFLRGKHQY